MAVRSEACRQEQRDLKKAKSQARELIGKLYDVERDAKDLAPHERLQLRRTRAAPVAGRARRRS